MDLMGMEPLQLGLPSSLREVEWGRTHEAVNASVSSNPGGVSPYGYINEEVPYICMDRIAVAVTLSTHNPVPRGNRSISRVQARGLVNLLTSAIEQLQPPSHH